MLNAVIERMQNAKTDDELITSAFRKKKATISRLAIAGPGNPSA